MAPLRKGEGANGGGQMGEQSHEGAPGVAEARQEQDGHARGVALLHVGQPDPTRSSANFGLATRPLRFPSIRVRPSVRLRVRLRRKGAAPARGRWPGITG